MKVSNVDKNAKLEDFPKKHSWGRPPLKYPFCDMEIGESVSIKGDEKELDKAGVAARVIGNRHDKKFSRRKVSDDEIRVWRVG